MADDAIESKKTSIIVALEDHPDSMLDNLHSQDYQGEIEILQNSSSQDDLLIIAGDVTKIRKLDLVESTENTPNNVDIHLETPQAESAVVAGNSDAKPKRLSDEFFSADDGDEDLEELDEELDEDELDEKKQTAGCSTSSSKTNSEIHINEFDDDGNISEPAYISEETSSCSSLCYQNSKTNYFVQSYDELNAIEREDFEQEQKLTGQLILKNSTLIRNASSSSSSSSSSHRLNLGIINTINLTNRSASNSNEGDDEEEEILENDVMAVEKDGEVEAPIIKLENEEIGENVEATTSQQQQREAKLTATPTSSRVCNKLKGSINKQFRNLEKFVEHEDDYLVNFRGESSKSSSLASGSLFKKLGESSSTSSSAVPISGEFPVIHHTSEPDYAAVSSSLCKDASDQQKKKQKLFDEPSTSKSGNELWKESVHPENMEMEAPMLESEHDEDNWADCEEGSDNEEICTCRDYADEDFLASSEDELPSRDVDLSSYTQLDSMSDDIFQEGTQDAGTPKIPRKRKLTGCSAIESPSICMGNRKRMAIENGATTPRSSLLSPSVQTPKSASSMTSDKRTPRLIPTKENPPPELMEWLLQFQRWSNAERLLAVDRLIEQCEPTQVRYMMKVIEPQFQRDFISLLPKELALQVLSFLEPKDLLRAAQTCRSWRFLADDNLLWKDKCKKAGIISESSADKPKRGRTGTMPPIASPWKAAYMRHHTIECNWRTNPIRNPKVLKGHDDHVITCLQFCGNRIVSGSDDNTLKVWSAVSGKCLRTLIGHTGGVWSSQMAGNIIISGSTDRTLKVWNAETGQCLHTLYGHTSTVRCMHLHGNK
jgi:hypothetical protein